MKMPGSSAPAFFLALLALGMAHPAAAQSVSEQPRPQVQPPASIRATPSQLELSKMLWSTIAAVDHANRSGNYSVLRDLSAQGFQIQNNPARLTEIFSGIRNARIDLSSALLVPPTYNQAPQMIREDLFRVQGFFQIRPVSIAFDVYYQWEQGQWKLVGIDLQPVKMLERMPD
ncbi:hypothetical protein [Erythrobacter sp. HKB08]|uniref:hypothetical protein n=1 Tax=Erythrobacter sp. HKB08 TaxID=2502843 RepID=UPI0013E8EECF|nr:hypothetical protein [Erythrobacter sp. HKB08]